VRYEWTGADASAPGIAGTDPAVAVVVPPVAGSYRLRLTVTDDAGRQDSTEVTVAPAAALTAAPEHAGSAACPASVTPPPPPIEVTVTPAATSVTTSTSQTFTATVSHAADATVSWRVDGVAGGNDTVGTISADGLYTAPSKVPSPAAVTVTAVANADSARSANAAVTVVAASAQAPVDNGDSGGGAIDSWLAALLVLLALHRRARRPRPLASLE
jgi:hypothetical protein